MVPFSSLTALGLAATHVFAGRLRFRSSARRSVWLSMAGGLSVGYVLVPLLPFGLVMLDDIARIEDPGRLPFTLTTGPEGVKAA